MRWVGKQRRFKIGERREVVRFLWFRKRIGRDCRWLEWACIAQEFVASEWTPITLTVTAGKWKDIKFL